MPLVHTPYGIFGSSASEFFSCKPVEDSISSNNVAERVGKSPVAELLEYALGAHALRHLQKLRLGIFSCKPLNDYISSNSVGERVGKSPVAHLHF